MSPRPLPPYDRPGLRCFVHPEVHLHSQVGFKSLQHSVMLLGHTVVPGIVNADIMLYDPDQSDPSEYSLPAIKFGWVDHCVKAGKLLPFAAFATATSSDSHKASQVVQAKARALRVIRDEALDREVIDLTLDSTDGDDADSGSGLPEPPSKVEITASGLVLAESNPALTAWYERYVEWALDIQPSRTTSRMSKDMAMLVPAMSPTTFFNFVRRSDHHVAKYLQRRITSVNKSPGAGPPGGRMYNRQVTQLVEAFVARRVSSAGGKAPPVPETRTPEKPGPSTHIYHKPQSAAQVTAKPPLVASERAIYATSDSDSDDSMAMFDRRPVKHTLKRRNAAPRRTPPRAATFRISPPLYKRDVTQAQASWRMSIEELSLSEDDSAPNHPAEVQVKLSPRPRAPSARPRFGLSDTEETSSDGDKGSGGDTDTDGSEHIMEFKRVKHTFRLHATPPVPPAARVPAEARFVIGEEWDSWFLSYVDWALQRNPQRDKYSVYAEMSKLTGNSRMAWKSVSMRLRDQVDAAFRRARGKGRWYMSASSALPVKVEVASSASEFESDAPSDVSDLKVEDDNEPKWDSDGRTSGKEEDDNGIFLPFEGDHPPREAADLVVDGPGGAPTLKASPSTCEDIEKYDEDPLAEQEQPGSETRMDDELDTMAWLMQMTPNEKMHCVWEWLNMQYPGQQGGTAYWEQLYHRMQTTVDARVQKIRAESDDC